jgi:pantoate--beta-alanine ligase
MEVFDTPDGMRAWSRAQHLAGRVVGCVPTMGALHAGHLALVAEARRRADVVVVTIFVNPLQFDRRDDFDAYPRPIDSDLGVCAAAGVDAVYAPTAAAMYPPGFQTQVTPGTLAEPLEGASRPGHFTGVTTVVTKLFGAVQPDLVIFGQKDFQQLAIVRRMVADLDQGVEIVGLPTVREPDGLALSSRNRRLSPADRAAAVCVPEALDLAAQAFAAGARSPDAIGAPAIARIAAEPRARLEYLRIVDPATLDAPTDGDHQMLVVTAVWFGEVRLIDNRLLG